ncbi:hypothetical protein J6590_011735 [Homalodisca vitripennis]|nr:hypothetical protein J6590_011735 [Homalodisca vitripennis]
MSSSRNLTQKLENIYKKGGREYKIGVVPVYFGNLGNLTWSSYPSGERPESRHSAPLNIMFGALLAVMCHGFHISLIYPKGPSRLVILTSSHFSTHYSSNKSTLQCHVSRISHLYISEGSITPLSCVTDFTSLYIRRVHHASSSLPTHISLHTIPQLNQRFSVMCHGFHISLIYPKGPSRLVILTSSHFSTHYSSTKSTLQCHVSRISHLYISEGSITPRHPYLLTFLYTLFLNKISASVSCITDFTSLYIRRVHHASSSLPPHISLHTIPRLNQRCTVMCHGFHISLIYPKGPPRLVILTSSHFSTHYSSTKSALHCHVSRISHLFNISEGSIMPRHPYLLTFLYTLFLD